VINMATIEQLKQKREELAKKYQQEAERAKVKRDIANIQAGRSKVAPTGWQKLSAAAKPYIANVMKPNKGKKKSNWNFSGGINAMVGTSTSKKKPPMMKF